MMNKRTQCLSWLVLGVSLLVSGSSLAQIHKEAYQGFARSGKGELLYEELHEVTFNGDQITHSITRYLKRDGKHFATMDSDYSRSTKMPTYSFKDEARGYEEGLAFENGKYVVYFQDKGKRRQSKVLQEEGAYACQGWHYFLVNNLGEIEKGRLALRLILPGKLDTFRFEFEKVESTDKILKVKLHVANWVLQIFAPSLRLVYDKSSRRLIQYNGVSNILKDNGDTQEVEITYKYES